MRVLIAVGCTKRDISMLFKTLYISTVCTRVITALARSSLPRVIFSNQNTQRESCPDDNGSTRNDRLQLLFSDHNFTGPVHHRIGFPKLHVHRMLHGHLFIWTPQRR